MSAESSLRDLLAAKSTSIKDQGDVIRNLKTSHAQKSEIDEAVNLLIALKHEKIELEKQLEVLEGNRYSGMTKEEFRKAVDNVCQKHQFYYPTGVAGYYKYGYPGEKIEQEVIRLWHEQFVDEDKMEIVDSPPVLSEAVLKASGHVDKFTDIMVKDEKTGASYRADHLLKDHCKDKLEKDHALKPEDAAELKDILAVIDNLTIEQVGAKMKEYGIVAPDTKNPLSDPFLFNLMFPVELESGPGYYRPELAQGIFSRFKHFYEHKQKTIPFAVAEVGNVYRNEISPRQKLLRLREFKVAEIEHFVDPKDKSHLKFSEVSNLELLMLPAAEQKTSKTAKRLRLDYAVTQGIISSETLAYYIGRVYLFLTKVGISKERLRFRQHLPNEMAHYASDCWDAEIEISYGWIECVGISDRGDFDMRAHSEISGIPFVACEKFAEPKEVVKLVIMPNKRELGPAFKRYHTCVVEALKAMTQKEAMKMKVAFESQEEIEFAVCEQKTVRLKRNMVSIIQEKTMEQTMEHARFFYPHVIEPSFGISRILYCLYEHCFYTRPIKGNKRSHVFRFPPSVAPIKCAVFSLIKNQLLEDEAARITESFENARFHLTTNIIKGAKIGQKYANADELGVPFSVTVSEKCVKIRERDSGDLITVNVDQVVVAVKLLINGKATLANLSQKLSEERDNVEKLLKLVCDGQSTWFDIFQKLYPGSKSS